MADALLRDLPKMDLLLAHPILERAGQSLPYAALRDGARDCLETLRQGIKTRSITAVPTMDALAVQVESLACDLCRPRLRRVINATGVVLHTNLGRAPLAEAAARAAYDAAGGYSNLEYDLESGRRGSRFAHVEALLCRLTGAEAALVVNNNAAAVFLMLSALAGGKGVAISRGELVEIGGGFRVPDMMGRSGAALIEVGTTNKTRLADYEQAILAQGAQVLLKVHTSNYEIVGFTEEAPLASLAALSAQYNLPLLYDLGSGTLSRAYLPDLLEGPTVEEALTAGADVLCFSGDKLLGGPQAGIVLGKKKYIDAMKGDPIARVTRIDKLSLSALEATLLLCQDPTQAVARIPTLSMLNAGTEALRQRAEALSLRLAPLCGAAHRVEVLPVDSQVGGGAMPNRRLPSCAVAITPADGRAEALEDALRHWRTPIITRISRGKLLIDVRTLTQADEAELVCAISAIHNPC